LQPLGELTSETILAEEIFEEIFGQEDEIYKARLLLSLEEQAAKLGVKTKFNELVRVYKRVSREIRKQERSKPPSSLDNWTNFVGPYDNMFCGSWIAREDGIYAQNMGTVDQVACYHPILPVERLKNLETGEEQIKIAYKRNQRWEEIIVPKTMVTSANKIVNLSGKGISVTSENARLLVRYLSDVENMNSQSIEVQYSSSKLGWIKGGFIPYDKEIVFDGDSRFRHVFESIGEHGSRKQWYDHAKQIRASGRVEPKFMLAASLSSVLIHLLGGLSFIVDMWGFTEGGKTISLMFAASVWADPEEHRYIGDFKTTDVNLEVRADFLNHLPVMLDDTSKKNRKIEENFEGVVYDLCSGKGKSRSNKELGLNRENHWRSVILTNGERPLTSYVNQGGAINRILEIECGSKVYKDPQETLSVLKNNYGFAGKDFVDIIKEMGTEEIKAIQQDFQKELYNDEKMQKQSIALSIILTADKIATEQLFQDGQYISIDDAKKVLIDRKELSDNERCYQYILGEVEINAAKFDPTSASLEKWGNFEKEYVVIKGNAFDALCKKGGFSQKAFLSWANKMGLVQMDGKNPKKNKKIDGRSVRCVFLKLDDGLERDADGFILVEGYQEELPFA